MNEYYSEKANLIQYKVNYYKRITSYYTVLKISSFMGMLISLFVLWNHISRLVPVFIILLILFIIACALQGKFYRKVLFFKTYKKVLDIEIDADNGKYDELSSGDEFINTDHLFTSDLDIFGNNSVFTQVNRTCTVHGKKILANNFISPFIDKKEIKNRQEAIRELSRKNDFRETFRVMGHPLISQAKCVYNNVEILKTPYFLIVTGANMAGKSTYLRAIGVNYILACIGAPVCTSYFEFYPTRLITSLHTSDSLLKNESYFFSELKKIKLIIDNLKDEKPIFILLDEILKGTNSFDKQRGSVALIEQLIRLKSNGIIATHDLQLGDLENKYPQYVKNYHFSAKVTDDTLSFDYKIKPGIVTELNAYFLMQKMGIIKT